MAAIALALAPAAWLAGGEGTGGAISLADALERALERHPSLELFDVDMRRADARLLSASLRPNPELAAEAENFGGSGPFAGSDAAEYTFGIEQALELGGKRRARMALKEEERESVQLEYEVMRREVIAEVRRRFTVLLLSQLAEENARKMLAIAKESLEVVSAQVEGGRGSAIDLSQAELGLAEGTLVVEAAERDRRLAVLGLAALWQADHADFYRAKGVLPSPSGDLPSRQSLESLLGEHPRIKLAENGVAEAEASQRLERANAVPDVTLGVGYRRHSFTNDNAMVAGVSIPLSIFNRNQGGIAEASAEADGAARRRLQAEKELRLKLAEAHGRLRAAHAESLTIEGKLLPAARESLSTIREGYRLGRLGYPQLLQARRTLTELEKRNLGALDRYYGAHVELESLTGKSLQ